MADASVWVAVAALALSAVGFFYGMGKDNRPFDESKLDQIVEQTKTINKKLDDIADWQREAASIHASHTEQLKTLFNRVGNLENRMEDRGIMMQAIQKILEAIQKILEKVS